MADASSRGGNLGRNFTIVGAATLASRLTGFARDMLVAAVLGAGPVADAYVAAFLIPNLFRRIIGEGAFNAAYVPIFTRREAEGGRESATRFAEAALSFLAGLGLIALLLAEFAMPALIGLVAPGFTGDPAKFADAVAYGRLLFPYVAIVLIVAAFSGTLNAIGRYAVAAWAPVLLNVILIAALLYCLAAGLRGTREAGFVLVAAVPVAGLLNLAAVGIAAGFAGYSLRPCWPRIDADLRRLMLLALPGIAVVGSGPVNMLVAAQMSSTTPSAVSWLYFADRIFQLPLGFVVAAVGVVLLPAVSRHLAGGDPEAARAAESRALEFALLVGLPAAMGLAIFATPIVGILFERGAFTPADSSAVAGVLTALAAGLPFFVLVKVLLPAFLAREDMRGPILAAVMGLAANVAVALALHPRFGAQAAPMGVAASAAVNAAILLALLLRNGRFSLDDLARRRLPRLLATCALTGLLMLMMQALAGDLMQPGQPIALRGAVLAGVVFGSIILHLALAHALRAMDLLGFREAISR